MTPSGTSTAAIAVVGMAGRFPGASNLAEFWRNLRAGVESLESFNDAELIARGVDPGLLASPDYVKAGSAMEGAADFDAAFFGINPREAEIMDPQHRVFLECAWEAIEDAGYDVQRLEVPVGVFAGASMNSYLLANVLANAHALAAVGSYQAMIGNDKDFLATRASYKLNLRGPSLTVQTACSTSLVAVHLACQSLLAQECGMALAGGVSLTFPQRTGYLYQQGMIASPDAKVRPFDAKGRGIRSGEGVGLVVLKRLDDAIADGDSIRAVILGTAVNNDGAQKIGYSAPSVEGQAEVIAKAQSVARVDPDAISYIEAHGTSTPIGDPIEIAALTKVFRARTARRQFCAIGSVKGNIGHADAAAGIAGFIKTVLALQHGEIPPSLNYETANPQIDFAASPFYVNARLRAWQPDGIRCAGISSFGIGGTNAHAVVQEWRAAGREPVPGEQSIVLSARSASALDASIRRLADFMDAEPDVLLGDLAYTLQTGRRAFEHRALVLASDPVAASASLHDTGRIMRAQGQMGDRAVTFMFSGQGSQYPGMGWELYLTQAHFRRPLDACAEQLQAALGLDLRAVLYPEYARAHGLPPGAIETLDRTDITQPALFAVEYALTQLWKHWGLQPQAMIGHSIGEYVAACVAGVFTLEAALAVVAARGALMQQALPGAMLAVQLDEAQLAPHLENSLAMAAVNGPNACTVSGTVEDIDALSRKLVEAGTPCRRLRTSHAFHSAMMDPVVGRFVTAVSTRTLGVPRIPFISNLTGTWITAEQATDPTYWGRHLRETVRFADGLRVLCGDSRRLLLELGPGDVLTSFARRTLPRLDTNAMLAALPHPLDRTSAATHAHRTLGRAWLAGAPVDWKALHSEQQRRRIALPTYPFESRRFWIEPSRKQAPTSAASHAAAPALARQPLEKWFWVPSWCRSAIVQRGAAAAGGTLKQRWLAFVDDDEATSALSSELRRRGVELITVRPAGAFTVNGREIFIRPAERADYGRLFEQPGDFDCVLHLWNATGPDSAAVDLDRGRHYAFYSLLYLAQALGDLRRRAALRVLAISTDMQRVTGSEQLRVERSLLTGPILVMPQDIAMVRASSVDIDARDWNIANAARLADIMVYEAQRREPPNMVAYRNGYRWEQTTSSMTLAAPARGELPLRDRGVYLITGGTGGLGLAIARHLATAWHARLVLTSRSGELTGKAWQEARRELEEQGGELLVLAADAADASRMAEVVAQARARFGTVHGVIHAAGVAGHGILQMKNPEHTEPVLRPKLEGTLALDSIFRGSVLDFLVLFSSINTAVGWRGTTDYSSANAFLDAFAQSGRADCTRRLVTINWGRWRDVGMAALATDHAGMGTEGMQATISEEEGIQALYRVLSHEILQVYVTPIPMPDLVASVAAATAQLQSQHELGSAVPIEPIRSSSQHERPPLQTPFVAPRDADEAQLAAVWAELLGIAQIGAEDSFFELGGHSLLAIRLLARIQDVFGVGLPMRAIFEAATVAELAKRIRSHTAPQQQREEIEL